MTVMVPVEEKLKMPIKRVAHHVVDLESELLDYASLSSQYKYSSFGAVLGEQPNFFSYISPNTQNACFIDATFELFWNAILPFSDLSEYVPDSANPNSYEDCILKTYALYCEETNDSTDRASMMARKFVWSLKNDKGEFLYPEGEQGDCSEVMLSIINGISYRLGNLLSCFSGGSMVRLTRCNQYPNDEKHLAITYFEFPSIINLWVDMYRILSEKLYHDETDLEDQFNQQFLQNYMYQKDEKKCSLSEGCEGIMVSRNILEGVTSFPPFLFILDMCNFVVVSNKNNVYFPATIRINDSTHYSLHGRVYSTASSGSHFYTICYKQINGKLCLVEVDNLRKTTIVLTSDPETATKILKTTKNTVYVCYKKN